MDVAQLSIFKFKTTHFRWLPVEHKFVQLMPFGYDDDDIEAIMWKEVYDDLIQLPIKGTPSDFERKVIPPCDSGI